MGNLQNLTRLDLSQNQLTTVPKELGNLQNLTQLDLHQNPSLVTPPPEVIKQRLTAILTYLRDQQDQEERQWISKLLVVGEGGVGKTSLLRALRQHPFKVQQNTTHGIEIDTLSLSHPNETEVTMILNTWDFGGQDIYHATHQFFLTKRSLYLLVWNARIGYEQSKLLYWLKTIRANAPDSSLVLVATWVDERLADLPLSNLQVEFPQIKGLYKVSNKTNLGIPELRQALTQVAADLPLMGEIWPENWLNFATHIRQTTEKHTTPQAFRRTMTHMDVPQDSQPVLTQWLHELGDILYFHDNKALNNLIILKPQWVTEYISIVLEADTVLNNYGIFNRTCMDALWHNLTPGLRNYFLELMEEFDLSYKIPEDPEDKSLVVECLDHEPPNYQDRWTAIQEQPHCSEISMKFQLSEILAGIPTWFIARQHRFTLNLHWRTGVLFGDDRHTPRHLGLLRVERDTRTNADFVRLTVRGPMPQEFFTILRDGFELTLKRYPGLTVTRLLPCPDPDHIDCRHEFDYRHLERKLLKQKRTIECPNCDAIVSIDQLLFGLDARTQDLVLAKLDQIGTKVNSGFQELRSLVQRQFLQEFKREQRLAESYCPNLFVLTPADRKTRLPNLGSQRMGLQLYCQYPGEVHPTCNCNHPPTEKDPAQGYYPIDIPAQWLQTMAPYISRMVRIFKYAAPLVSPVLGVVGGDALDQQVKADITFMNALVKKLPDINTSKRSSWEDPESEPDSFEQERLTGSQLRTLRHFLKRVDPEEKWGGLRRILTPEGDYLWLCEKHAKLITLKEDTNTRSPSLISSRIK